MDANDIRTYLAACKQSRHARRAWWLVLPSIAFYIVLRCFGFGSVFMDNIALGALIGAMTFVTEVSLFGARRVSKADLLAIIEKQINRDSEALEQLSEMKVGTAP